MPEAFCDVVVIGPGVAGLLAAIRAAERGRRTLLLENQHGLAGREHPLSAVHGSNHCTQLGDELGQAQLVQADPLCFGLR